MKQLFASALLCVFSAVMACAQAGFPALYDVTGVAADDVLNIRAEPSGSADILGEFGPHRTEVEVTGATADGRWLRVNTQEATGWVAARFLQRPDGGDFAFGRMLNCFGTEPFWSLDVIQGSRATFSRMDGATLSDGAGLLNIGQGRQDRFLLGFGQGLVVVTQAQCSDGMSDRLYALEASVVLVETGMTLYSGCCSIQPE